MGKTQATIISEKMEKFFGIIYRDDWDLVTDESLQEDFNKYWVGVEKPAPDADVLTLNVPQLILKSSDLSDFSDARLERGLTSIHIQVGGRVYAILPCVAYGGVLRGSTIIVPRPQLALSPLLKKTLVGNITAPDAWLWYAPGGKLEGFYQGRTKLSAQEAIEAMRANQFEQLKRANKTDLELNAENLVAILESIEEFEEIPNGDLREFVVLSTDDMFKQIQKTRQSTSKRSRYVLKYGDQMKATFDDTEQNNPNVIVHVNKGNYRIKVDKYTSTVVSLASQYTKNRDMRGMTYYYDPVFITDNRKAGLIFKLQNGVEIKDGTLFKNGKSPWDLTDEDILQSEGKVPAQPFIQNNKLKRQWMYEKFLDQAMFLTKEKEYYLQARVVLTELYGGTLESGIIISESFAERAETDHELQIRRDGSTLSAIELFRDRYPDLSNIARGLEIKDSGGYVKLRFTIPLSVGDKITNMHGNKGTISMILPDKDMPYVSSQVGEVPPGYAEVVLSNNIIDRGTYGQLVEIFSLSNNMPEIENIKDFLDSGLPDNTLSDVVIMEETFKRTSGLMTFCAMEHFAAIKQTIPGQKFLKIGEMEALLLAGMDQEDILLEIMATSPTRRSDFRTQRLTTKPSENVLNNALVDIINSLGLELKIDGKYLHVFNNTSPSESSVEDWKKSLSKIIN